MFLQFSDSTASKDTERKENEKILVDIERNRSKKHSFSYVIVI